MQDIAKELEAVQYQADHAESAYNVSQLIARLCNIIVELENRLDLAERIATDATADLEQRLAALERRVDDDYNYLREQNERD